MGLKDDLMDKMRQVAGDVGKVAKRGASQVQAKVEQTQLRRKADDAATRLGYLVYRERTGGTQAGAEVDAIVAEIKDAEDQIAAAAAAEKASGSTTSPQGPEVPPAAPGQAVEEATGE